MFLSVILLLCAGDLIILIFACSYRPVANMFIPCKSMVKVYSKDFSTCNKFKYIISKT